MVFANIEYLFLLLLLIPYIVWYIMKRKKTEPTLQISDARVYAHAPKSYRNYLLHVPFGLRIIALILIILVLARPQTTNSWQNSEIEGIDIMLAIDVSTSMLAEDLKPNRLEAAKDVAAEFINGRPNDNIGITLFAGESFTQCPLTVDHAVLLNLFQGIKCDIIEDGTAVGMGIANAVTRLKDSKAKSKVIILLTDGTNNKGDISPLTAAEIAKSFGIRVYTIGVGTNGMAPYPVPVGGTVQYINTPVEIDEKTLTQIAGITVLFPAYKEDRVILSSVRSFLEQDYPKELFDLVVISDQMQPETNEALRTLPIRLLMADYTESSKAKALAMAMNNIDTDLYDIVVIMDADNVTVPEFLSCINRAFDSGVRSIQAHRTGKNLNTDISILDSASEEINNGFFRNGHNALGLSAGLSGSGMAFDAKWFQQNVQYLQTAGEDKELESMLLQQRIHTVYLNDLPVFDEKTQKKEAISNQRKRWIAAQFGALRASLPHLPKALLQGNIDYCDKIFQWMLPPRLIQLAGVFGLTFVFTVIGLVMSLRNGGNEWTMAIKWWILSVAQVSAMILPVPGGQLFTKEVGKAIMKVPMLAVTMTGNLFKLKGANKKFIHTEHGEHHSHS